MSDDEVNGIAGVVYDAIDRDTQTFRVLQVESLDTFGRPICRMRNALVEDTTYYALSYTWGSPEDPKPIVVNNRETHVRSNLEAFLRKATTLFHRVWIWVDALCINQNDLTERNHQVQQMGSIYTAARKVIIWLGTEPEGLHELFWQLNQGKATILRYHEQQIMELVEYIIKLDENPYWRRIWIIQELLLARSIQIMYDNEVISWKEFWNGVDSLQECALYRSLPDLGGRFSDLTMFKHRTQKSLRHPADPWFPPEKLFRTYASFECSNELDRVFALLPLFDSDGFVVDYNDTKLKLILRVWLHLCCKEGKAARVSYLPLLDFWSRVTMFEPYLSNVELHSDTRILGSSEHEADWCLDYRERHLVAYLREPWNLSNGITKSSALKKALLAGLTSCCDEGEWQFHQTDAQRYVVNLTTVLDVYDLPTANFKPTRSSGSAYSTKKVTIEGHFDLSGLSWDTKLA